MIRFRDTDLSRVGIIGIIVIIAVILTGLQFGKVWPVNSGLTYRAVFDEVGGLEIGDNVAISGVTVGTVTAMELDNGAVATEFTVDANVLLGTESIVKIKTSSALGKRQLEVESVGETWLRAGEIIPVERTISPYSLTDALGDLTTGVEGTDTETLNSSLDTLSSTLDQATPELGPTFDGLTRLSSTLNTRDQGLRDLLDAAGEVTGVLAKRSAQVNSLILNANDLLGVLNQRRQAIVELLANTAEVATQLDGVVADNEAQLKPALDQLNSFTDMLIQNRDNISALLPGLATYMTALGEAVSTGPWYNAYVANLIPAQMIQPFINSAFDLPPQPLPLPGGGGITVPGGTP